MSGHKLLGCLAQLLPLLDASRRRAVADELFEAPAEEFRDLDRDRNVALRPCRHRGRRTGRPADRPHRPDRSDTDPLSLPRALAPHLTEGQASTLLEALPARSGQFHTRNAVLTRWASFGRRQTIQAFDEAYTAGASDAIDPGVMRSLRAVLSGDRDDEPTKIPSLDAWWRHAYDSRSSPQGGTPSYRRDPQVDADDIEAMLEDIEPDPDGRAVVDVAFALARRMTAEDVPWLLARARTLADPWLRPPARSRHPPAQTAQQRTPSPPRSAPGSTPSALHHCEPTEAVVSVSARQPLADARLQWLGAVLRAGRVPGRAGHDRRSDVRRRVPRRRCRAQDLDRWATDALGLTPLLTHEQLASWEVIARQGFWSAEDRSADLPAADIRAARCAATLRRYRRRLRGRRSVRRRVPGRGGDRRAQPGGADP